MKETLPSQDECLKDTWTHVLLKYQLLMCLEPYISEVLNTFFYI